MSASVDELAQQAAAETGLPVTLTRAMIQLEGTYPRAPNGGVNNNPFNVVSQFATDAGLGQFVTGLWNSIGVAIFSDPSKAVDAMAYGINNYSNYATLRAHIAAGAPASVLAKDLQDAGWAGSSTTYATALTNIMGSSSSATGGSSNWMPWAPGSGIGGNIIGNPYSPIPILNTSPGGNLIDAINNVAQTVAQFPAAIAAPFVTLFSEINAWSVWLSQPHLLARIVLGLVGAVLLLVGAVMFGLSLAPRQAQQAVGVAAA